MKKSSGKQKLIPIMTRLGNLLAADDAPAQPLSEAEVSLVSQMANGHRLSAAYASVIAQHGANALPPYDVCERSPRLANAVYDAMNLRLMLSGVPIAIRVLENIMQDERAELKLRLAAANSVLDRAGIGVVAAVDAIDERSQPKDQRAAAEALDAALRELGKRQARGINSSLTRFI